MSLSLSTFNSTWTHQNFWLSCSQCLWLKDRAGRHHFFALKFEVIWLTWYIFLSKTHQLTLLFSPNWPPTKGWVESFPTTKPDLVHRTFFSEDYAKLLLRPPKVHLALSERLTMTRLAFFNQSVDPRMHGRRKANSSQFPRQWRHLLLAWKIH